MVSGVIVESEELPPIGTNAFLLVEPEEQACVVIDAPESAHAWATRRASAHGCRIAALILTHGHWDHMLDAHRFAADGIPVYAHLDDKPLLEAPERMAAFALPGLELKPVPVAEWLGADSRLDLLGRRFVIRHVPGHCPGNILVYLEDEETAFVGDVIFAGSVGRYDLPGGDFAQLQRSIREQVYTLPGPTALLPGHGPPTTVDRERSSNPIVRP